MCAVLWFVSCHYYTPYIELLSKAFLQNTENFMSLFCGLFTIIKKAAETLPPCSYSSSVVSSVVLSLSSVSSAASSPVSSSMSPGTYSTVVIFGSCTLNMVLAYSISR